MHAGGACPAEPEERNLAVMSGMRDGTYQAVDVPGRKMRRRKQEEDDPRGRMLRLSLVSYMTTWRIKH